MHWRLVTDRCLFERTFSCFAFGDRQLKRTDPFPHFVFALRVLGFFEIVFKRFERFFLTLQSIGGNTDVVLKLSPATQPIGVSEVYQRALVVGLLERRSAALEVLARRRVVGRLLC